MIENILTQIFTKRKRHDLYVYAAFLGLFIIANTLIAYFPVTTYLSDTLDPFRLGFFSGFLSFVSNLLFVVGILMLGLLIFKKRRGVIIYAMILNVLLAFSVYAMVVYNKYYNSTASLGNLTFMRNPAGEMGKYIALSVLYNLTRKNEILVFCPALFVNLLGFYLLFDSMIVNDRIVGKKGFLTLFVVSQGFLMISTGISITDAKRNWGLDTCAPEYIADSSGYYTGYTYGILLRGRPLKEKNSHTNLNEYNKNQDKYTNVFKEEFYRILKVKDAENLTLDDNLKQENLNGMFKGKNLVLVELESINHYLMGLEDTSILHRDDVLPNLKALLKESYVFENMHDNAGVAHTSDGDFAVLNGLIPRGDDVLYWNYYDRDYSYTDSIPRLFKGKGYRTAVVEGDAKNFYNKINIVKNYYKFDEYYYFDKSYPEYHDGFEYNMYHRKEFTNIFGETVSGRYSEMTSGLNDQALPQICYEIYERNQKEHPGTPIFIRPVTLIPHAPFGGAHNPLKVSGMEKLDAETKGILEFLNSIDEYFRDFHELAKKMPNTVFFFNGDHGATGVPKKDLEVILGKKLSQLEYRHEIKRITSFMYVPSLNGDGLFKGSQPRVRSQIDIYRTLVELFDLETKSEYYGVNLFSKEHTVALDPKGLNLFADEFLLLGKSQIRSFGKYDYDSKLQASETQKIYNYFKEFKKRSDQILNYNLFDNIKVKGT